MIKHTPGPWEACSVFINNSANHAMVRYRSWGGVLIADCGEDAPETMANARLIASAPDLLAALEEIAEYAQYGTPVYPGSTVLDNARAAIRKAKGE